MKQSYLIGLISLILTSSASPTIELEKRKILGDKIEILLPKDFKVMSEDMMKVKYPSERRPTLVYSDESGGVNVAFNHTANKANQQQIDAFKDNFVTAFKNMYPSSEWKGTGTNEINGRKVGYLELVTPGIDTKIYNLMFFTDLDGRLLLCTFNCVEKKQNDWIEPAKQIMNSLKIK